MKADLPVTPEQFFEAAEQHGLRIISNVSTQKLKVAALDGSGLVVRFFAPDLRVLPDGTEITGTVGVALMATDDRSGVAFPEAMFHHIVNLTGLRRADRLIRDERDWGPFFQALVSALEALPSTPEALAAALADSTNWMGKRLSWGDGSAVSFERTVRELSER